MGAGYSVPEGVIPLIMRAVVYNRSGVHGVEYRSAQPTAVRAVLVCKVCFVGCAKGRIRSGQGHRKNSVRGDQPGGLQTWENTVYWGQQLVNF